MRKGFYEIEVFEDCFYKLSSMVSELFYKNEINHIRKNRDQITKLSRNLIQIYDNWITSLLHIAERNDLLCLSLIEPIFILTRTEIEEGTAAEATEIRFNEINKKLVLIGSYNFDQILKTNETTTTTLDHYFNILKAIPDEINFVQKTCLKLLNSTKEIVFEHAPKIINTSESFKICKKFYSKFQDETEVIRDVQCYSLHYEPEMIMKSTVAPYLMSFKTIPQQYNMLSYYPKGKHQFNANF